MTTRARKLSAHRMAADDVAVEDAVKDLDWQYGKKAERPGGGAYRAEQNPDGTWNIFDIPAFASHKMLKDEGSHEVDADWQRETVNHHLRMWEDGGFLNPLIINHHKVFGDVFAGGHFLPTRVAKARLFDKSKQEMVELDATFFDLMYLREDVYAAYRRGELPYLSPEFAYTAHLHVQLSALDTDSPWFKFPLITIGEEIPFVEAPAEDELEALDAEYGPSLASRHHAHMSALAIRSANRKELEMQTTPATTTAKRMDDNSDTPPADDAAQTPPEGDVNGDGQITFADVHQKLTELMTMIGNLAPKAEPAPAQPQPGQQPQPGTPVEQPPAARADDDADKATKPEDNADDVAQRDDAAATATQEPAVTTKPADPEVAKRFAEQQAKITRLEASEATRKAKDDRETAIRSAEQSLADRNIPNLRAELEKVFDDKTMGGATGVAAYAEACKRHFSPAPPESWDGEQLRANGDDPQEVLAYLEHGPEVHQRARSAARAYEHAVSRGLLNPQERTLEKYLSHQPGLQNVKLKKPAKT